MKNKKDVVKLIREIEIPSDINIVIGQRSITFEKDKDESTININPVYIEVKKDNGKLKVIPKSTKKKNIAVTNTVAKLILNAINGFTKKYIYKLAIVYSHFPMTVKVDKDRIMISNFLGGKKSRAVKILPGCEVSVDGKEIVIRGKNKYNVGQTAGNLEKRTKVTKKDYRVFDDGCYIISKGVEE